MVFKTNNLLIWHRAAGIGDELTVLASGMAYFKEQPFDLIILYVDNEIISQRIHYLNYYKEIVNSFTLCKSLVIMDLRNTIEIERFLENLDREKYNIYYLPDYGDNKGGRYVAYDNMELVLTKYKNYFQFNVNDSLKKKISPKKINICTVFEGQTNNATRLFDTQKWVKFITWLAERGEFNIHVIFDNNPNNSIYEKSLYFTPKNMLQEMVRYNNIYFYELNENGSSLSEALYCLIHCDLFCGHNGGFLFFAWMLGKPAINFYSKGNLNVFDDSTPNLTWPVNNLVQRMYYLDPELEDMQSLFNRYYMDVFLKYKDVPMMQLYEILEEDLKKEIIALFKKIPRCRTFSGLNKWYFYDEAYFNLGYFYLINNMEHDAIRLLDKSDGFVPLDGFKLYEIGRYFKDKNKNQKAVYYLKKALNWSLWGKVNRRDVTAASHFHLAEIYLKEKNNNLALDHLIKCLDYSPEHNKARQHFIRILKNSKEKLVIWGTGERYNLKLKSHFKHLNIIGFVENNSFLWGREIEGVKIFNPAELNDLKPSFILICSSFFNQIKKQILAMNFNYEFKIIHF